MKAISLIEPGSTTHYYCDFCLTEYRIQLEPKAAEHRTEKEMESKAPKHCPFCGETDRFAEA